MMNKITLVQPNDPILKEVAEPFSFEKPQIDPLELFNNLRDTMCANKGVGLAAPQIGLPVRVFVIGNPADPESIIPVFNPIIVDESEMKISQEEGCLTFPGLYIRIKRSRTIRARYTTHENVTDTIKFDGLTARAFQHEYDHLDGVLYLNRANRYHIDRAKRQKSKMDKLRAKNVGRY